MKVSGSILAVHDNYMEYARQLKYANVDCLHIDIFQNSGEFKLEHLLDFDDKYLPLDVHLIYEDVSDEDIEVINSANVSYLNVQYENLSDKGKILDLSKRIRANFGIAYTIMTPIGEIVENLRYCSQVLFMCSEPGVSGANFDEGNYDRIREFHENHPEVTIFADGGIDNRRAEFMVALGVSMIVSGSYLCKGFEQLGVNAYSLKYKDEICIQARNKMLPIAILPIVQRGDSFERIIDVMNRHKLGLDFVLDDEVFIGVIADGDIRRGFIRFGRSIFDKKADDLMNADPYCITSDKTIKEIYEDISKIHKGIDVIPVVEDGILVGGVNLRMGT